MDNILSHLINMLRSSDPMGPDTQGINPIGVEGANYSANQMMPYSNKEKFGRGADTTARIQADIAGQRRPNEGMNGIMRMFEAIDAQSRQ